MSPDLRKEIWAEMQATGDRLKGLLPPDPRHPQGRNPHAHVAGCVLKRFRCSYKELPEERIPELRAFLKELEEKEKNRTPEAQNISR